MTANDAHDLARGITRLWWGTAPGDTFTCDAGCVHQMHRCELCGAVSANLYLFGGLWHCARHEVRMVPSSEWLPDYLERLNDEADS